jgi:heme/copper-type cytochrome/quinol oxidase subunit 4
LIRYGNDEEFDLSLSAVDRAQRVLIVFLVITGSVWIIANLNSSMMPMSMK